MSHLLKLYVKYHKHADVRDAQLLAAPRTQKIWILHIEIQLTRIVTGVMRHCFFFPGRGGGCITYTRFTAGRLFPGFFGVAVCTVAQYLLLQSFHSIFNNMFLLYSELSQRLHDFISLKRFYWQIHKSGASAKTFGQQLQLHPKEVDPAAFAVLGTAGTVWAWPL